ncbi:MAG: alpha/beta hydrolase, partial [Acidobacteriota bacterium]
ARRWAAGRLAARFDTRYVTELADVHARLDVPVALVWGEKDPFFPLDWTRAMVDTFPNAHLHVVPKMKLFVHEERPAEVARAILPTLTHGG